MSHILDSRTLDGSPLDSRTPGADAPATARAGTRMAVVGIAVAVGALFAAAALLWVRHGPTVFFDIMNAGIASCM